MPLKPRRPLAKRPAFWLLVAAGAVLGATWFLYEANQYLSSHETGENLSNVDWLPDTASNISYYRSYLYKAYEFDISESEFLKWSRWDVTEITDPVTITRYNKFYERPPYPPEDAPVEEFEAYEAKINQRSATITQGLHFAKTKNNGGGTEVAYDRKLGRAYFHSMHR